MTEVEHLRERLAFYQVMCREAQDMASNYGQELLRMNANTADKRPPGRPPLPTEERLIVRSLRLTQGQWDKLARLGGVEWLRERIAKAKEPK
jgi:hypothetical protein